MRLRLAGLIACASVALCTAIPTSASAITASQVPPINSDVGAFTLPISCAITIGQSPFTTLNTNVTVQGVAAASLGPGQRFYLSEGSGAITFPSSLSSLAGQIGVTKANATITQLNIAAENSTPNLINVASTPIVDNGIPIPAGQPFTVGLPQQGTFTVGPYTAPKSGTTTLQFKDAVATVQLLNSSGGTVLTVGAHCTPTAGNALLTIAVGGPSGQPPSKISGVPLNLPTPPSGNLYGIVNAPYTCTGAGMRLKAGIAFAGQIPLSVRPGGTYSITNASGALTIPASTVNRLLSRRIKKISGTVNSADLTTVGATPATDNVAAGFTIPPQTLTANTPVVVPLPQAGGPLTVGPFTQSGSGNVVLSMGPASASFTATVAPFNRRRRLTLTCRAPSPPVILAEPAT